MVPAETPASAPAPKSRAKRSLWIGVVLGLALMVYIAGKPSQEEQACQQALDASARLLAGGDAAAARSQVLLAATSCSSEAQRAKLADLRATADKVIAAQASCERGFRSVAVHIAGRRLQTALQGLDQLDSACVQNAQGTHLRQQIEQGQRDAASAEAELHRQLQLGDAKAAKAALEQLIAGNREHPEIPALRLEVQNAARVPERIEVAPPPVIQMPSVAGPGTPTAPAGNSQAELAQTFLRDAEAALTQLKFDAAKTYVESARRIDPSNAQAAALLRRIKERELQYLKDETTIK